jgi:hypothetical protein
MKERKRTKYQNWLNHEGYKNSPRANRNYAYAYFNCSPNVLHHKDPDLRHNDPQRYMGYYPEDLVILTRSEHTKLHRALRKYVTRGPKAGFQEEC